MRCVYFLYAVALLGLLSLVAAAPALVNPLSQQHPPVARVDQPFTFTALPDTFTSNATTSINYTASALPNWLQFAPQPPTFFGTPGRGDVGEQNVSLIATDSTGSRNVSLKLIVSDKAAPELILPFDRQLADNSTRQFASVRVSPDNKGITVDPYWSFSLGWSGETFRRPRSGGNGKLYYSAYIRGETGLPDWLEFSNTSFTFNAVAPSNGTYPVVVTATDLWGYTAAETSFVLSVGEGAAVESSKNWTNVATVSRNVVQHKLDLSGVLVDGKAVPESQLTVSADLSNYGWLSFDNKTNTLSGVTPDSLANGTATAYHIPFTMSSAKTSNTLSTVSFLGVDVLPYAFTTFDFPSQNITAGEFFQYSVADKMVNRTQATGASVIPGEAAEWLLVFPENQTVVGNMPTNITYSAIDITFVANTSAGVASTANVTFAISGVTGPKGEGEPAPIPEGSVNRGLSQKNKIIIGVVVGVVGFLLLLALLLLLFCCCRKRKRDTRGDDVDHKETTPDTLLGTPEKLKKTATASPDKDATLVGKPSRFGAFKSLFGGGDTAPTPTKTLPGADSNSFTGSGELVAAGHGNQGDVSAITRAGTSFDSIASWQSAPSVHWSGENEYLEPLYEGSDAGASPGRAGAIASRARATPSSDRNGAPNTPRTPATPSTATDAQITTPTFGTSPNPEVPRPKRGFYPKYPRNMRPGDPVPVLSSDQVPSAHFSEFDGDFSSENGYSRRSLRASQSLDSFADPGSQIAGSSRFGSAHSRSGTSNSNGWWKSSSGGRPLSGIASHRSEGSLISGEWFNPQESALSRLASSGLVSGSTFSSNEPAVVATAQRRSLESQRPQVRTDIPQFTNAPSGGPSVAARRQSSRRNGPRLHSTREHIVAHATSPPHTPMSPEHLIVEEADRLSGVSEEDPDRMIVFSQHFPRGESPFFHAS